MRSHRRAAGDGLPPPAAQDFCGTKAAGGIATGIERGGTKTRSGGPSRRRVRRQGTCRNHAKLLDQGTYLCSIRTMYRVLDANQEVRERRNQLRHPAYAKPQLMATAPNQVWTWDITKLLGPAKWTSYYLYMIIDIYSRYVVGWMLAHRESQHLAARLIRETFVKEGIHRDQLTIHSDRGPAMRSQAVAQLLATLGVTRVPQQTARQR